jgi:hypothetical protein
MRLVHTAILVPLALLTACGGAPEINHALSRDGAIDFFGPDAMSGGSQQQQAAIPSTGADPSRLKGLSPLQVRSVLGTPMFTRRDAPAEIWQYRGRACTLDLFIYDENGAQKVAHYAVRSPQQQAKINEGQCLSELVSENARSIPTS